MEAFYRCTTRKPETVDLGRFWRRLRTVAAIRVLETVVFNLTLCLTLGPPFAVLPTVVHWSLGYGPVLAGLAVSLQ